jgi:UDP-N-acetylmuramoyl-L-alanyl-D-glutamate--2,6-diaminopimelate ligase
MERVTESSDKIAVFVDYSHTPDALEKALNVLRPYCKGRLVVVFGCGGNRDQGKRPMMGKIAATLADVVVVTDDNPRNEDANKIKEEIISAAPSAHNIGNRRDAIKFAISTMQAGDVLLIAGKGHEKTQIIKDEILPFDDVQVAKEIISEGLK